MFNHKNPHPAGVTLALVVLATMALREGSYDLRVFEKAHKEKVKERDAAPEDQRIYITVDASEFYGLRLEEAAFRAAEMNAVPALAMPAWLLCSSSWNDAFDWAKEVLLGSGYTEDQINSMMSKWDPLYFERSAIMDRIFDAENTDTFVTPLLRPAMRVLIAMAHKDRPKHEAEFKAMMAAEGLDVTSEVDDLADDSEGGNAD